MNKNTRAAKKLNKITNKGPSQNVKRNMEQIIIGGKTVHRPINPNEPFFPHKRGKSYENSAQEGS